MGTPKKVKRDFGSLTEFVNFALGDSEMGTSSRSSRQADRGYGGGFYGTPNFKAAEGMAFNWPEGAERVNALRAKVSLGNIRKEKEVLATRKAPGRIDMGRAMMGHPYAFQRVIDSDRDTTGSSRNVVDIVLNACVSAFVSTDTIEARGAAMLALAEALEQRGKRVRITVGMANESGCGIEYKIVVKQPGQPLNLNSVAFAVAHPSFFRRFVFSAMETESASVRRSVGVPGGYGRVGEFKRDELPANCIYMGGADLRRTDQWNDPAYVQEWIKGEMRKQGIEIS
jgi:hypothetical protein